MCANLKKDDLVVLLVDSIHPIASSIDVVVSPTWLRNQVVSTSQTFPLLQYNFIQFLNTFEKFKN